jgi:predicted transcriptional regulator
MESVQLENDKNMMNYYRSVLDKFERSKILEVYFARLDGRMPDIIPEELKELYEIELISIKSFLLGQHPQDPLLHKIFRMMN